VLQALRRVFCAQPLKDFGGAQALGRSEGVDIPFGAIVVVDRDEGRFATHGQANVTADQLGIDLVAERLDRQPLLFVIRLGDPRRFPDALDLHVVLELALAFLGKTGDWRRRRRLWRARQRDVSFAGEQPGGWIETDPAGAGQVDLAPGVQVGEVVIGSRRAVERFYVGHQLDQVTRDKARRQPEVAQQLHQQPG
jgi:hypothetical protein